ncbi:MAG: Clp1/GlmU family protein [bacterium]
MEILDEWIEVKDKVFESDLKVVFILGEVDTGKTTFVKWLANQGVETKTIGIIDADVGQSDIGPPTTIGLGIITDKVENLSFIEPVNFYFVGDISPEGHLLDMVVGTKKLLDKALAVGIDKVIIDTTGLVQRGVGEALKFAKVKNIGPCHIIAIQRKNEIEYLLKPFDVIGDYVIHRIPVSSQVRLTSKEERAILRNKKFVSYFKNYFKFDLLFSEIVTINTPFLSGEKLNPGKLNRYEKELDEIILYGELINNGLFLVVPDRISLRRRDIIQTTPEDFKNLLVGLIDEKDNLLGLGIIENVNFKNESIKIKTPIDSINKVKLIKFSEFKLNLNNV